MAGKTILVVDDERDLLDLIEYNLKKEGYDVLKAEDGLEGIRLAKKYNPNLVLLDIMMPNMDGLEVIDMFKANESLRDTPIVFLTARADEKTELKGLDKGADDYLTKPISPKKLVSRINAVLRRLENKGGDGRYAEAVIRVHDLTVDKERYIVTKGEQEFKLPKKEFELLYFLALRKGKVLDRQTLLNQVWGNDIYVIDRTVDVHVRKIREKLGEEYIETVKGVGYRFKE